MKNCKQCDKVITTGDKRKIFCDSSCAAKYNNRKYPKIIKEKCPNCLNCGKTTNRPSSNFCSVQCRSDNEYKTYIKNWKNGLENGFRNPAGISGHVRRYFFEKYDSKCSKCGWNEINEKSGKVPLHVDHINGKFRECNEENLQLICPNCHSLTPTYGSLNAGNGGRKTIVIYS